MDRLVVMLALAFATACTHVSPFSLGPPTDSTCAPGSTLTYQSFGQTFMDAYCTRCHASTLKGPDRNGAPLLHDFDTLYGIEPFVAHIDQTAASGPAATNTSMPVGDPMPTLDERKMLGEWLACGTP
jgi:hypothetical protein